MKKWIALMLAVVMVLSLCACSIKKEENDEPNDDPISKGQISKTEGPGAEEPEKENITYAKRKLVEVGQVKDPGREIYIRGGAMLGEDDEGNKVFLNVQGEAVAGIVVDEAGYLGAGMYEIKAEGDGPNRKGVLDVDGNVLIPCEYGIIGGVGDGARYLYVVSIGAETASEDQALLSGNGEGYYSTSLYSERFYTGTCRVYDYEAKQFVPNVAITLNAELYGLDGVGDSFIVDNGTVAKIYNADGEVMLETENDVTTSNCGIYCEKNDDKGGWVFYDDQMQMLSASASRAHVVEGSGKYVAVTRDGQYILHKTDGTQKDDTPYDDILHAYENVMIVHVDYKYGLYDTNGKEILPMEYDSMSYVGYGLYCGKKDGTYSIIARNGSVLYEGLEYSFSGTSPAYIEEDDDTRKWFVYKDMDFTLEGSGYTSENFLMKLENDEEWCYGLYDLLTGEELLERKYDIIDMNGRYIYALRDNIWYIYELK